MKRRATTYGNADIMRLRLLVPRARALMQDLVHTLSRPDQTHAQHLLDVLSGIIKEAETIRAVAKRIYIEHSKTMNDGSLKIMREFADWDNRGMDMPEEFRNKIRSSGETERVFPSEGLKPSERVIMAYLKRKKL